VRCVLVCVSMEGFLLLYPTLRHQAHSCVFCCVCAVDACVCACVCVRESVCVRCVFACVSVVGFLLL